MKTILIYNEIGGWGIYANEFKDELDVAAGDDITIRLNSPGGSVMEGLAMYNLLKSYSGKTTVQVDSVAASIASIFMLGADEIIMGEGSFVMIHNPLVGMVGEADDLRKEADLLDSIKSQMVGIYKNATGLEEAKIVSMMDETTWLSADEAIEKGFASSKSESLKIAANLNISSNSNLSFNNIPEELINMKNKKEIQKDGVEEEVKAKVAEEVAEVVAELEETPSDEVVKEAPEVVAGEVEELEPVMKEEAPTFTEEEVNAKIEEALAVEAKRVADIKALAFEGQDSLVEELVKERVNIAEAGPRIINHAKENSLFGGSSETSASKGLELLNNAAPGSLASETEETDDIGTIEALRAKASKELNAHKRKEIHQQINKLKALGAE